MCVMFLHYISDEKIMATRDKVPTHRLASNYDGDIFTHYKKFVFLTNWLVFPNMLTFQTWYVSKLLVENREKNWCSDIIKKQH